MSKYYKAEDVIRAIDDAFDSIPMEQTTEMLKSRRTIKSLPTIEVRGGNLEDAILLTKDAYSDLCLRASKVSEDDNMLPLLGDEYMCEDAISRANLIESFLADNECKREEAKACMCSLDLMLELIDDEPSVIPQVPSEDAISREVAMDIVVSSTAEEMVEKMRNAPSVIPQQKEGEWYRQTTDHFDYWECSECGMGVGLDDIKNYCPNCGAKMKGAER